MFEPDLSPRHAQRRQFIRLVGGGAVLAALPALAACGSAAIEEAARVPGDERDPRAGVFVGHVVQTGSSSSAS